MLIKEAMTQDPKYITPDTSLEEAARQMRDLDVGMLPVGDGVTLKGMITDRDITVRIVAEGRDLKTQRASDAMTTEVLYAFEDEPVEKAIESMKQQQVRRLVVLNRDKKMTGIIALADIAEKAPQEEQKAEALEGVSKN